jgi:hypothetical protein
MIRFSHPRIVNPRKGRDDRVRIRCRPCNSGRVTAVMTGAARRVSPRDGGHAPCRIRLGGAGPVRVAVKITHRLGIDTGTSKQGR